jgi:PDZ domain-containing secreted protein
MELAAAEREQRGWSGYQLTDTYRHPSPQVDCTRMPDAVRRLRMQARVWIGLVGLSLLLALLTLALLAPTGKVVVAPGHLLPAATIMRVPDPQAAPSSVQAVTVDRRRANVIDLVRQRVHGGIRIQPMDPETSLVVQELGDEVLRSSFAQARYAALVELHQPASFVASKAMFTVMRPDSPFATAGIRPRDVVERVGSQTITTALQLVRAIDAADRAAPIQLTLADGRRVLVQLPDRRRLPHVRQVELKQALGAMVLSIHADVKVAPMLHASFRPSFEGGSAGLAIGAATLQAGGVGTRAPQFAATGSLYADGSVGTVDDVTAKTSGVAASGVRYFLVPRGNAADARAAHATGVEIVPIDSITDVSRWLAHWDHASRGT